MVTPLSERLRTDAKPDSFTSRDARSLGWTLGRYAVPLKDSPSRAVWRVRKVSGEGVTWTHEAPTCSEALRWIRRVEDRAVLS